MSACDDEAIGLFGADAHSQGIRQLVGADLAQDEPALGEEGIGLLCCLAFRFREVDQHEIRRARRHDETELSDFLGQPGKPAAVVCARAIHMRRVADCGYACGDRGSH